jgi:hypothetical protein
MPNIDLSILNQRQTPAFFADTLANRPAPSFVGRIFISTDTLDLYRDTGSAWLLLSPSSTGTITGSGAAGQVTYFSGTSSITGNNNLFWDSVNSHLGIKTTTPDCALDVNHDGTFVAKFNNTAAGSTLIGIFDQDNPQWLIGTENVNDSFKFYDATNFPTLLERVTFKTNGQTFIGTETTSSGRLVVNDATGDNHIVVIGATAPSIRINNVGSGATKQIGIGLATTTNNFIQGAADRDMAIFNSSTTASPILFGIYDAGLTNTQEAARISAARNFLIGTTTDGGQKLQINGGARASGYYLDGMTLNSGALYFGSSENRVTLANYNVGGILRFEVNGGTNALTINSDLSSSFKNNISCSNTNGIITLANGNTANGTKIQSFDAAANADGYLAFEGFTKEYARFNSNGNFGIGITTPNLSGGSVNSRSLTISAVAGTGANGLLELNGTRVNTNDYVSYVRFFNNAAATPLADIQAIRGGSDTTGQLAFATSNSEAMRISASQNVLIGTTTDAGQKLQVSGTTYITGNTGIGQVNASDVRLFIKGGGNTNATFSFYIRNSDNTDIFYIRNDGFINTGNNNTSPYNNSTTGRSMVIESGGGLGYLVSTRESKTNINSLNNSNILHQLNPVSFNYRKKDNLTKEFTNENYKDLSYGFIADEVEKIDENLVFYDVLNDGTKKLAGVEYNKIIALLVKEIQLLHTKIENIK